MDYTVEVLSDVPGLSDAGEANLRELSKSFTVKVYPSGSWICHEGEEADRIFILGDGEVDVIKRDPNGKLFKVAVLTAGSLFGHVGVMTLNERTASIRAAGEAIMLEMTAQRARDLLREERFRVTSPFRRALIVALSRQLNSATATTMRLASDVGITGPVLGRPPQDAPLPMLDEADLPPDTEEILLKAHSQV